MSDLISETAWAIKFKNPINSKVMVCQNNLTGYLVISPSKAKLMKCLNCNLKKFEAPLEICKVTITEEVKNERLSR